jgi:heme exporter protein B
MALLHETWVIIHKDALLEIRQKYSLGSMALYVFSTVFVTFLAFSKQLDPDTWNALFWIIVLFASVNSVSRSFVQEGHSRNLYYYTLVGPKSFIFAKMCYHSLLLFLLSAICFLFFALLMDLPYVNLLLFIVILFLGSAGLASVLTMMSAIASRSGNYFTLTSILGLPILLPLLISLISASGCCLQSCSWSEILKYLLILVVLDMIVFLLSFILFPYLWKD